MISADPLDVTLQAIHLGGEYRLARHFLITQLRPVALGVGVPPALTVVMSARSEPPARRSHVAPTVTGLPSTGPTAGGAPLRSLARGFSKAEILSSR